MKKVFSFAAALLALPFSALAGGFLTNTNQSVQYVRNPAQNAVISVGAAYFNPAGVGFLEEGWHFGFNAQNVHQKRQITSTYAPFAYGTANNGKDTKKFKGTAVAPILPSFDAAFVKDKWFASFHFGVNGGGGKAKFPDGLGSFESQIAIYSALLNQLAGMPVSTYSADISMTGQQYVFGGQLNVGYRFNDHWSVSAGLRTNYVTYHSEGAVRNINVTGLEHFPTLVAALGPAAATMFGDRELDCRQKDWAFTPVVGVDFKTGAFNFAARYEFNTRIRLENETADGKDAGIAQYKDGKKGLANDIPALFCVGAEWSVTDAFRLDAGFNYYFDKQGKLYNPATDKNDKTDLIDKNTYEVLLGAEYDVAKKLTLSLGGHVTRYRWGNDLAFAGDLAFNPTSLSVGGGCRYAFTENISVDLGVYKTFYGRQTKKMADYDNTSAATTRTLLAAAGPALSGLLPDGVPAIPGKDRYWRDNIIFAIGLNLHF